MAAPAGSAEFNLVLSLKEECEALSDSTDFIANDG